MKSALFVASYESRNFDFDGVGETEGEAANALIQGLRAHAREYGLEPRWWWSDNDAGKPESVVEDPRRLVDRGIIRIRRIERGTSYRDREELPE